MISGDFFGKMAISGFSYQLKCGGADCGFFYIYSFVSNALFFIICSMKLLIIEQCTECCGKLWT